MGQSWMGMKDPESFQGFGGFFKMGEITGCLYTNGNQVEGQFDDLSERGENCRSHAFERE